MIAMERTSKVSASIFVWGLILFWCVFVVSKVSAQTYVFDEGIGVLTEGLISKRKEVLIDKKIAVFGIIESKSREKFDLDLQD